MKADGVSRISTGIAAAVLLLVAVYYGTEVLAPLTLAFFIIAIVWPLQQWLQLRLPALVALAIRSLLLPWCALALHRRPPWPLGGWAVRWSPKRRAIKRFTRWRWLGSKIGECQSPAYGLSISIPDGCCVLRGRSQDA